MKKVFADTGYWIALLNPEDDLHPKARQIAIYLSSTQIVTSQMIFTELLNAFSGKGNLVPVLREVHQSEFNEFWRNW